jgi:hypothetical protein
MKRNGREDQMRGFQTIGQIHVQAGDGRRGWDEMRGIQQLSKFTYALETEERKYQMKGIQTIDQVHVQAGDGCRGWHGMIR